jgi:sortase B
MEGSVMFGEIPEFLEEDYFNEHTTGTLFLPEHTLQIRWFACVEADAYDIYLFDPEYPEEEEIRNELLDYIRQEAVQYRDIGVTASDRIVALSTCEDTTTDGRILLIGEISGETETETESETETKVGRRSETLS